MDDSNATRERRFTRLYEEHHETVRRHVWPRRTGATFALALPFRNGNDVRMHLVAYDAAGRAVGRA